MTNDTTTGMTARDYQHKRFRSRAGDSGSRGSANIPSLQPTAIDSAPPRIVTPPRTIKAHSVTSPSPAKSVGSEAVVVNGIRIAATTPSQRVVPSNIEVDHSENSSEAPVGSVGSDEYSGSGKNNIGDHMKRLIEPYTANSPLPRSPMVHKPTVINGVTVNSPMKLDQPLRYSLADGKDAMPVEMRRASDGMLAQAHKSKLQAAHSLALKSTSEKHHRASDSKLLRSKDPHAFKIFILLLQPKSKIFELIQLVYSSANATLGDLISMIPENATEKALGSQKYVGLCRPNSGAVELKDMDMLASEHPLCNNPVKSAKITLGEILVAIPQDYSGEDVALLSKQILANPKIVKLLKRSDPLAPKKSKRSSRHHHRHSSSRRTSSRDAVQVLFRANE